MKELNEYNKPVKGTIVLRAFLVAYSFVIASCSILQKGYNDHNGQYLPKNPNFQLKDKSDIIMPKGLDTVHLYRMIEFYSNGQLIYPKAQLNNDEYHSYIRELQEGFQYIKFYGEGRCLKFTISTKDSLGNLNELKQQDLDPNGLHYNKCYYHSNDGENIQIEIFTLGDGYGAYVISNYQINDSGDTLVYNDDNIKIVYKREELPPDCKNYNIDW